MLVMNSSILIESILIITLFVLMYLHKKREKALDEYSEGLKQLDLELRDFEKELHKKLKEVRKAYDKYEKAKKESNEPIMNIFDAYNNIIIPTELVKNMTYDDFIDWLELGTKQDIIETIKIFERYNLNTHIKIMKIHLERMK